MHKAFDYF
uniref:Uncharacterized protein n=1 Tax=Arundo donax TaxID=35708 RepID=A0A0A9DLK7_ARUDO